MKVGLLLLQRNSFVQICTSLLFPLPNFKFPLQDRTSSSPFLFKLFAEEKKPLMHILKVNMHMQLETISMAYSFTRDRTARWEQMDPVSLAK